MSTSNGHPADAGTEPLCCYPGERADPITIEKLAIRYHRAAERLAETNRDLLGSAPTRLLALHAIELYLNAFLRRHGHQPREVRALQHDIGARIGLLKTKGVALKRKTTLHCTALVKQREYLISRYDLHGIRACSPLTRVLATLNEVAEKTASTTKT